MEKNRQRTAMRVSAISIAGNVVLSVFKLIAGIVANSSAMVSDAVHSMSDVLSTVIVMFGVRLANKQPDKDHPYGHERFECVAAIILAVILFVTGVGIGLSGLRTVIAGSQSQIAVPEQLALIAAVLSIVVKEAMYQYVRAAAKKINSGALMASAWHNRSDALSSVGSLAGIIGARVGFPVLDPAASVVICFFILKIAVDIFRDAIGKMTDRSCDDATEERMRDVILSHDPVVGIDVLRTRLFGDRIYVDLEISVDGSVSLDQSHETAQQVHDAIESEFPNVKHCTVHTNPADLKQPIV